MKKQFSKPLYEVVRFNSSIVATSFCGCDVLGEDFGYGKDEGNCLGAAYKNNPECASAISASVNCV